MRATAGHAGLAAFASLQELYAFLLERSGDRDERDRVLAALVDLAREHDDHVVSALLWLALWPGLCGVYIRRRRRRGDADEVVSAIALAFTLAVHELDASRVHRIAATLVRNTERRVADLQRPKREEVGGEDVLELASRQLGWSDPVDEGRRLHEWLTTRVGQDGHLLFAVLALGDSTAEAAARLGLSPAAAKKRYQRALARLRAEETRCGGTAVARQPEAACA
jgi:RNA polymerase sigma-70 factor (ECF subfamily)